MKESKKQALIFVVVTYLFFWCSLIITGGAMKIGVDEKMIQILTTLCAWTPTATLCILFHRILPKEQNIITYMKKMLKHQGTGSMAVVLIIVQSFVFIISVAIVGMIEGRPFGDYISISVSTFLGMFLQTILAGATGEEMGWRGFLHFKLTDVYGVVKGSIFVGIIWSFWHAPLWFVSSGYQGKTLLLYILAFLISNISAAVIIGICFHRTQNILIPVCIHFMFNFTACFYQGDLLPLLQVLAIFYFTGACVLSIFYTIKCKNCSTIELEQRM